MNADTDLRYSLYKGWKRALSAMDTEILRRCTKIRVKAWRKPNEDGAERLQHVQWDGSLSHRPLPQPECLRCYPRCFQPMGHAKPADFNRTQRYADELRWKRGR